ncbi:MAG: hypothetical protein LBJ75_01295 [Puniceicoccales bacterium]|jgi:hypothetical protein|nr:hypothetical protein [Puniceicoccales bacterium]
MTGITQQYTVTVGNNTNVTATTQDLTAEQQKALAELQKKAPGDISISADGVISITSRRGLSLFNSFCANNRIQDSSTNSLMKIDAPTNSPRKLLAGLKSVSAFCTNFGNGEIDPSKMNLTELMTLMFIMTYEADQEKSQALSDAKKTEMAVAAKMAVTAYEANRTAAEKTYTMEIFQAVGNIAAGCVGAGIAIGGTIYAAKSSLHQKQTQLNDNDQKLKNNQLLQDQADLKAELNLPDTQGATIEARRAEVKQEIATKSQQINAKQQDIDNKQIEINSTEDLTAKKELEADKIGLENQKKNLNSELEGLKAKEGKLEQLSRVNEAIEKKGITPEKDSLSDGEVKGLEAENKQLEAGITAIKGRVDMLTSLSGSVQSIIKGAFDLYTSGYKKEAAFLGAEAQISEAFRNAILSNVQGLDASINTANQNMQKSASALKQMSDETYNVMASIAQRI